MRKNEAVRVDSCIFCAGNYKPLRALPGQSVTGLKRWGVDNEYGPAMFILLSVKRHISPSEKGGQLPKNTMQISVNRIPIGAFN